MRSLSQRSLPAMFVFCVSGGRYFGAAASVPTRVAAFSLPTRLCGATAGCTPVSVFTRRTSLKASFFDDLQAGFKQAFSTMASSAGGPYYTVAITGSSGLVGTALIDELSRKGGKFKGKDLRIVKLNRSDSVEGSSLNDDSIVSLPWNPKGLPAIDPEALKSIDTIVHLAAENVATGQGPLGFLGIQPWTDSKKEEIMSSRVDSTNSLATTIASVKAPTDLFCASGVGAYGYDFFEGQGEAPPSDETIPIDSTAGFLAEVSRQWEAATAPMSSARGRVVNMRFGVVLSKNGGALAKLYPVFFLGGGGIVGSGKQYFSFISARDIARAIVHTMETDSLKGPVNFCSPQPCTNEQFTKALGSVLFRPTILPLPGFAVQLLFGEMGDEMLLGGVKAVPRKLMESGFQFNHVSIQEALQSAVEETI